MSKFSLYIIFVSLPFCIASCISFFGWKKASKHSTKFVDKIPPKLRAWERVPRHSANLAPLPEEETGAVVQIYAAPLWGLRGRIADHTWISTKAKGASSYTVYEVIGWRVAQGYASVLRMEKDIPDRLWFGKKPKILIDLRGQKANRLIEKIHTAASRYPYKRKYAMLGPNSNTFTAWVACQVPELRLKLSRRAIGKNYLKNCREK